jgi:hypothetical protein
MTELIQAVAVVWQEGPGGSGGMRRSWPWRQPGSGEDRSRAKIQADFNRVVADERQAVVRDDILSAIGKINSKRAKGLRI